ncbi:TPM domain-containing protein [bacterium]|nr:TPM domain-containing protein [bacterium]
MKKILILLLMIFCVSLSCTACKYLISHGEVKDEAKVIMPDDMQKIESIINEVYKRTDSVIIVQTIKALDGYNIYLESTKIPAQIF